VKYVLDASVAVAALRSSEPSHAAALRTCSALFAGGDDIVVPAIFDIEVTAALTRRGLDAARVAAFFALHLAQRRSINIGPRAIRGANRIVALTRLRAADALYVWVAAREALPLVTLDQEVLARARLAGVTATAPQ
jgi:predicted nucleic acid-binding protein